jgi:hypothetical protein
MIKYFTGEMIADILTTPLHGTLFARLCAKLTGEIVA